MARMAENVGNGSSLHDFALINDDDFIGHVGDDAEVMGDQQHGHVELGLQLAKQLQNLGLYGDIESRGRFIGDDQRRPADQCHGDDGALAEAPRQLERIHAIGAFRILKARQRQHLFGLTANFRSGKIGVDFQRFADLVADRVQGRQRRHRLLKNHGNAAPAQFPVLLRIAWQCGEIDRGSGEFGIAEENASVGDLGDGRQNSHDGVGDHRFPRSGFADQSRHFSGQDSQAGALDGSQFPNLQCNADAEIFDPQEVVNQFHEQP